MKNQMVRFSSGDASLRISLRKHKDGFKTQVRHQPETGKAQVGCKNWFEADQEDAAAASFMDLLKDATDRGWVRVEKAPRKADTFMAIPEPPKAEVKLRTAAKR